MDDFGKQRDGGGGGEGGVCRDPHLTALMRVRAYLYRRSYYAS